MRSEELAKLTRVGYPTSSGAILRHGKLSAKSVGANSVRPFGATWFRFTTNEKKQTMLCRPLC